MDGVNGNDDETHECDSEEDPDGHRDDIRRLLEGRASKIGIGGDSLRHVSINGLPSTKTFRWWKKDLNQATAFIMSIR